MDQNREVQAAPAREVRVGGTQYFARDHLDMAKFMAESCQLREEECVQAGISGRDTATRSYALAALVEAAAFLEAAVRELWNDAVTWGDLSCPYLLGLDQASIDSLRDRVQKRGVERLNILQKYDLTLSCAGKSQIDVENSPGRDVKSMLRARNALVHFKPELVWADHPDDAWYTEHDLEAAIKPYVPANPLMKDQGPWFPHHLLCAGVARWAWEKSVELAEEWRLSLNLTYDYKSRGSRLWISSDA